MIKVAICDDEKRFQDQMEFYLRSYCKETGEELEILIFSSANDLIAHYPDHLDLLLLDIYMPDLDGMKAARHIRTFDEHVTIIFITTMYQCALEGYQVRAFGFVRKPTNYSELHHELDCAIRQIRRTKEMEETMTISTAKGMERVSIRKILYGEVQNHTITLHLEDGILEYRGQINALEETLSQHGFFRPHASFLISGRAIKSINESTVLLTDGTSIPISQRRRKEFLEELSDYIGEEI